LKEENLDKFSEEKHFKENRKKDVWIGYRDGEFGYYGSSNPDSETTQEADHDTSSFKLRNINVLFPAGKLTAIIGPIGSGKSSLLLTLLGEMKTVSGVYSIPEHHLLPNSFDEKSDVVYVPQTPWLQNATIKENILFGEAFDEERYLKVVKACALLRDLDALEYGDLTEVGEKGVNLSGGQKQRLSLARAAYSKAPIVLLDDPLASVDAPTARHLMSHCILEMFKGRTVLLVTHAVYLVLPKADHVVVVKNGSVFKQGAYETVLKDKEVTEIVQLESNEITELEAAPVNGEKQVEIALKSEEPPDNREGKVRFNTKS
jgi:ABC-type transport system involved in cytochrome bd biosynthesis fused ATPase/permease subunit